MVKRKYDPQSIEPKWQRFWEEKKTFKAEIDSSKPKYYVLDMFPYPSGAGLHVGHVTGYTATDILARFKRHKGFSVLHPMGWDSFGLPAEQYAIRTGTHPALTTEANINTYRRQLKALGFSYDWGREIATSYSSYYKWTQWIFTKLYEKGLAYEAEALVNYCPALGTVLANEEVESGFSKEGGYPVERKPLRQWVLKITAYAEQLLEGLDELDWPDYLKRLQRNWIGKSEGCKIRFPLHGIGAEIEVFTTCAETIYGVSFLVLAPEHPLVDIIATKEHKDAIASYKKTTSEKGDLERGDLNKDKSGVFTGAYALNPLSGDHIPVWIADYVLTGYGTGAVMGVPAHDERDFAFAQKYHLDIKPVIDPDLTALSEEAPLDLAPENLRLDVLAGKRCWSGSGKMINSPLLNELNSQTAKKEAASSLAERGAGECAIQYKLRDWLFSRQRYWGEPIPILHFADGSKRSLALDELPLVLPEMTDFKPSGDGASPLAKIASWVEITDPKTGKRARRETNAMPQWAGSCWYYLRFCDPLNTDAAWSPESDKYWLPVDLYVGGVEHAVLHLLYARFWHRVLYDLGYAHTKEPFKCLRNQGLVTAFSYKIPDGGYVAPEAITEKEGLFYDSSTGKQVERQIEKMSKSKLNGIAPDDIVEEYGADTLRLYEMFMGPFEKEKLWNSEAIGGCYRFLSRFHDLVFSEKVSEERGEEGLKLANRLLHGVVSDIEAFFFNTAIAKMMEFINAFAPLETYPKEALVMACFALSPFAPHLAEEGYRALTAKEGISLEPFPKIDERFLIDSVTTYVAQINGKVRAKWDAEKGLTQDAVFTLAKKQPNLERYLEGEIAKIIFVPDKLINIVMK